MTFEEWDACVADRGCTVADHSGPGRGKQPVIKVNWDDAKAYATWLSHKTGKDYRLLSEAEREYSAPAGNHDAVLDRSDHQHGPGQFHRHLHL